MFHRARHARARRRFLRQQRRRLTQVMITVHLAADPRSMLHGHRPGDPYLLATGSCSTIPATPTTSRSSTGSSRHSTTTRTPPTSSTPAAGTNTATDPSRSATSSPSTTAATPAHPGHGTRSQPTERTHPAAAAAPGPVGGPRRSRARPRQYGRSPPLRFHVPLPPTAHATPPTHPHPHAPRTDDRPRFHPHHPHTSSSPHLFKSRHLASRIPIR